jgi:hypothetical protein
MVGNLRPIVLTCSVPVRSSQTLLSARQHPEKPHKGTGTGGVGVLNRCSVKKRSMCCS